MQEQPVEIIIPKNDIIQVSMPGENREIIISMDYENYSKMENQAKDEFGKNETDNFFGLLGEFGIHICFGKPNTPILHIKRMNLGD
jgi:hypothetical protein